MLVLLAALVGGPLYYFTRSTADKDRLRAKFGLLAGGTAQRDGASAASQARPSKAENVPATSLFMESKPAPATGSVSAYSGSKRAGVLRSDDPKSPEAGTDFMQFAEALKISGAIQGNPAKAILNGKSFRAGDTLEPTLGVTFAGLDGAKKCILLRDKTGAELRVTY
ncbi:MAG: hypothetical protein WDM96_08905 [Lacunisphaera sp.]